VIAAHNHAGEKQRIHHHYLKGSVVCGGCGSRLIITNARSRSGKIYPYFVCAGRHQKRTDCTFKAVLIESVERRVEAHYASHGLDPAERDALEAMLTEEFAAFGKKAAAERRRLERQKKRVLAERAKLLQAHYAGALDLDQFKSEQDRIRDQLGQINKRLAATAQSQGLVESNLLGTLDLITDAQATYLSSPYSVRRQLNQALFTRIRIEDDGDVEGELAEPFRMLLSPAVKALIQSECEAPTEPDWQAWEVSFNEDTHEENPVDVGGTRRPQRGRGLNYELLVGAGGFEPP
jgi:site-specific DNA recombinase